MVDRRGKNQRGALNPGWKGGKSKNSKGYILIRAPEHPRASPNGYVFEHIVVLEKKIGRPLQPTECSHHINGVKTDNRPENLEVVMIGAHTTFHWSGRHHTETSKIKNSLAHKGLPVLKGEESPSSTLNEQQVKEIISLRGFITGRELARRFGISHQEISKIQLRQRWSS